MSTSAYMLYARTQLRVRRPIRAVPTRRHASQPLQFLKHSPASPRLCSTSSYATLLQRQMRRPTLVLCLHLLAPLASCFDRLRHTYTGQSFYELMSSKLPHSLTQSTPTLHSDYLSRKLKYRTTACRRSGPYRLTSWAGCPTSSMLILLQPPSIARPTPPSYVSSLHPASHSRLCFLLSSASPCFPTSSASSGLSRRSSR